MAWIRSCVNAVKDTLIDKLDTLGRSTTRWVKNSYYISVAYGGSIGTTGSWDSATANSATCTQSGGYKPALVTKCESGKTYNFNCTITGAPASEQKTLLVMFFNGTTYVNQIFLSDTSTTKNSTFTVPAGVTDVLIIPGRTENGTYTFTINNFTEM